MDSKLQASFDTQEDGHTATVYFKGSWLLNTQRPASSELLKSLVASDTATVWRLNGEELEAWDSSLVMAIVRIHQAALDTNRSLELSDLPVGVRQLLKLSAASPESVIETVASHNVMPHEHIGHWTLEYGHSLGNYAEFMGQLLLDFGKLLTGHKTFRRQEFWLLVQQAGVQALPIVALLSFLTGLIIGFIGIVQLQQFAADIYVADLVALVMTRELAAIMTGIIMAGRTGAAYAAQIGSMKVNEEVDALRTFGIQPIAFLVLPRVIALVFMMPLLTILADVISIAGGMAVAVNISNLSTTTYINETIGALEMADFLSGVFKSVLFGFIIAFAGCYRGLHCGDDAAAVGRAATSAVVTAITWIVIIDALFAVIFHILGI